MSSARTSRDALVLLLEAQSSLVRATIAWFRPDGQIEILCDDSRDVDYRPGMSSGNFVEATMKAVADSVGAVLRSLYDLRKARAAERLPSRIHEAHYILSSPWIITQARTLEISFESDTKISQAKVDGFLNQERSKLAMGAAGPTEIVEEKIFDVRLNGYSIRAWQDKSARKLEISYALGVAGSGSLAHFENACRPAGAGRHAQFHSSLLLQYVGLRRSMPARLSYILIHVHGELTDVVVVEQGSCSFFGSYPSGIHSIIRALAQATTTDEATAGSYLELYLDGHLEENAAAGAAEMIKKAAEEWMKSLDTLLGQADRGGLLPRDSFIVARSHQRFFAQGFHDAHPDSRVEVLPLDPSLYAAAIHSLDEGGR